MNVELVGFDVLKKKIRDMTKWNLSMAASNNETAPVDDYTLSTGVASVCVPMEIDMSPSILQGKTLREITNSFLEFTDLLSPIFEAKE